MAIRGNSGLDIDVLATLPHRTTSYMLQAVASFPVVESPGIQISFDLLMWLHSKGGLSRVLRVTSLTLLVTNVSCHHETSNRSFECYRTLRFRKDLYPQRIVGVFLRGDSSLRNM